MAGTNITIEGKIIIRRAYNDLHIPGWEKEVTYEVDNGYSIRVSLTGMKYQAAGDFLVDQPQFRITSSILKDGQVVSRASSGSEVVGNTFNNLTRKRDDLIEVNIVIDNLLKSAETDEISQAHIACQMPIDWKFSGKQMK